MAGIFYVSGQSDPPMPQSFSDKPLHGMAYFGLSLLVFRALAGGLPSRMTARRAGAALAITIGYAVTDELHQMLVPGRSPDVFDLYADAVGAAAALIVCWAWGILGAPKAPVPNSDSRR